MNQQTILPIKPFSDSAGDKWRSKILTLKVAELSALDLSVGRPIAPLAQSISQLGLLHPLWVAKNSQGLPLVISGGRRLSALKLLEHTYVPCLAPTGDTFNLLTLAFTDNLTRGHNCAEKALAWNLAKQTLEDSQLEQIKSLLGLGNHERVEALEAAAKLDENSLIALSCGRLDLENAFVLNDWPQNEAQAVLELFARTQPSRQNRRLWIEWLSDIRRITNLSLDVYLADPKIQELSGPQAEKQVRHLLFSRRFPVINQLQEKRSKLVKSLKLPQSIKLELDDQLEDIESTIKITFKDPSELQDLALKVAQMASLPVFSQILLKEETLK
jgi:ParB-like chromosome segregation protein Spo0J